MTEEAASLYVRSSAIGTRLGPFALLNDSERQGARELDALRINMRSEITCTSPGTFWAPSPYHAAILLQDVQYKAIVRRMRGETTRRRHVVVGTPVGPGPLLFRGHASTTYQLTPSLQRSDTDIATMTRAAKYFCEYFRYYCQRLMPPRSCRESFSFSGAQHYQIRTNLLDFSADPDIAVFFANGGHSVQDGQLARVYVVPIRRLLGQGLRVLLPPPLFSRIYVQRGVSH